MDTDGSFGYWVRRRRKSLDLTQHALAARVSVSVAMIRRLEADERRPSVEVAVRLAQVLEVPEHEHQAFLKVARGAHGAEQLPPARASGPAALPTTLQRRQTNLPALLTPLIGRAQEVTTVVQLLRRGDVRLITLVGPGGVGKTHLALRVAAELLEDFPDGVWFVDLASINDPCLVASAIATTFGVKERYGQPLVTCLASFLREKQLLLLLDNFEQVVAAAPLLHDLLQAAPHLNMLVTSREVLRLVEEQQFPVPPLAAPDPLRLPPRETLLRYPAVELFCRRAQTVMPNFALTDETAPAVVAICARLDGLPLAIELAAARVKLFSPQALLARLDSRLSLLTGGARARHARQQTLRNTLDWSYRLLSSEEQRLAMRLAVFVGGWTVEAAEMVCTLAGDLRIPVVDGLQALVDKSLVRQDPGPDGQPRLRYLETIREYAVERLAESGEQEMLRKGHAHALLQFAEQARPDARVGDEGAWLNRIEADHENLRAALRWAREAGDMEVGGRLAGALAAFWERRGYWSEGRAWLENMLAVRPGAPGAVPARDLYRHAAHLARRQGDYARAATLCEELLALCRVDGDIPGIVDALRRLGHLAWHQEDYDRATTWYEESLLLSRDMDDRVGVATELRKLGELAQLQGKAERAATLLEESLCLCRTLDNKRDTAALLEDLGNVMSGDDAQAAARYAESLALYRELGDTRGIANVIEKLGYLAHAQGEAAQAAARYTESLALYQQLGDKHGMAMMLLSLGEVARWQGNDAQAAELSAASLQLHEELGNQWGIAITLHNLGHVALHQRDSEQAVAHVQASLRLFTGLGDTWGMTICLAGMAGVAGARQQPARAARLFGAVQEHLGTLTRLHTHDRVDYERNLAIVRGQLDAAAFVAAWTAGQALTLEQAVAEALEFDLLPDQHHETPVAAGTTVVEDVLSICSN